MTIKASGDLSFVDIVSEFGSGSLTNDNSNISLGSYRIRQQLDNVVTAIGVGGTFYPLADGIPLPGETIRMSNFYNKSKTVIIEYKSTFSSTTGRSLSVDFANRATLVGAGLSVYQISPSATALPSTVSAENLGTAKVILYLGGSFGSGGGGLSCAYRINTNFNNTLIVEIGPNALISGRGGNGGAGGARSTVGSAGAPGGSALGISAVVTNIYNRGRIQLGAGGGGGGGGGPNAGQTGGGGGGGAGFPAGAGANRLGTNGNLNTGGAGGPRVGSNANGSGAGGAGGSVSPTITNASAGAFSRRRSRNFRAGGAGGANGFRMVIASGIPTPTITPVVYNLVAPISIGSNTVGTPL